MIIAAPAFADTNEVDVGKITCGEFLKADDNGKTFMLTWIDGYMSAQSENTVMSNEWMANSAPSSPPTAQRIPTLPFLTP